MNTHSSIEPLEARIAPAVFAIFPDVDGDLVTVSISKGVPSTPNGGPGDATIVQSPTGPFGGLGGSRLLRIDLLGNPIFNGASITVTATPQDVDDDGDLDGDGLVSVGFIDASGGGGIDLGAVTIDGDLGRILAGDADLATPGLKSLTLHSLGVFGTSTGAANLNSEVAGKLGALKVKTDLLNARIEADEFGPITVGGSAFQTAIVTNGPMGFVKVGGDWRGGDGIGAGDLRASSLAGLTIGGSLIPGERGGNVRIIFDSGPIKIGRDFIGNGFFTFQMGNPAGIPNPNGFIEVNGNLASFTLGGSLDGRAFDGSAQVGAGSELGPVKIARDALGHSAGFGGIHGGEKLASVTIGGNATISIVGDLGLGPVKIRGSLDGRFGDQGGLIRSGGDIASVSIGGSLLGGAAIGSGRISALGKLGPVFIGGDVIGGSGDQSGYIHTINGGAIASVTIGGSLLGRIGGAVDTGKIFSAGAIGAVKIGGDVIGGGRFSGMIDGLSVASVSVRGSVIGKTADFSGVILSRTLLGLVKIGGDLIGGDLGTNDLTGTGYIEADRIKSVFIGGSIISGIDNAAAVLDASGAIRANEDIGSVTVRGSLIGNQTVEFSEVSITARGVAGLSATAKNDVAIGKISIGGSMTFTEIRAGYDNLLNARNADAQIGSVVIGGSMISSSIIAGVSTTAAFWGTAVDTKISGAGVKDNADLAGKGAISKIGSVIIKGSGLGTTPIDDAATYGIVAQQLGAIKLGGGTVILKAGASNDSFVQRHPLGTTLGNSPADESFDFSAFEIA